MSEKHIADVSKKDTIQALYSILDYAGLGIAVSKLNDCNNCGARRNCKYVPEWGGPVRFNCPLWKGEKDD